MNSSPKISVVVPCFNEEKQIGRTLKDLMDCPTAGEIIVVDDGSTDGTLSVFEKFKKRIKIKTYKKNRGKGHALATGVREAEGEIVVFLDADIKNLKDAHLKKMTLPLLKNQAEVVLGQAPPFIDFFSRFMGQRAYWRNDLLPYLNEMSRTRFGIEIYLNSVFSKKRTRVIRIKDLVHLGIPLKRPPKEVPRALLMEFIEMAQTLARLKGIEPTKIREVLNPDKIKSIKDLRKYFSKIKNKQFLALVKKYILSYLTYP